MWTLPRTECLHHGAKIRRRPVAALGIPAQCAQHDVIDPDVQLHFLGRQIQRRGGSFSGEHFIKHRAQRIDVRAVIDLRVFLLLGSHVGRGARAFIAGAHQRGDAEVRDLDPTVTIDQPYLYVIRDRGAGTVLFIGRVTDPTIAA